MPCLMVVRGAAQHHPGHCRLVSGAEGMFQGFWFNTSGIVLTGVAMNEFTYKFCCQGFNSYYRG